MDLSEIITNNFSSMTDEYKKFSEDKHNCRCCSIFDEGKLVVQSEGGMSPTFVFIGEAPGKDEVLHCRPFIGKAGQRLREEIRKNPIFTKTNTLITNVIPCRPKDNKFPADNDLLEITNDLGEKTKHRGYHVVNECMKRWLVRELKILRPKIIITLGAHALRFVRSEKGVTTCRGTWKFLDQYQAWSFATFHPSYVLRCANDPERDFVGNLFEEDIAKVARNWRSIIESDDRMKFSPEEWAKERTKNLLLIMKGK
jgi:DNA polymerase